MTSLVLAPPRSLLAELDARQPLLARTGWAMLATLAVCLIAMMLDPRTLNGVSVWVKPAKFAAAFVAWFWTLAWAWGVLAPAARKGMAAAVVLWGTLVAAAAEQIWIIFRAALGLPSHFAQDPIGAAVYVAVMGVGAVTLVSLAALLGVLVLLRGDHTQPRPWRLAVGLGLLLGGVLGGFTGSTISGQNTPLIASISTDAGAFPPFFWSRDGGDLRVAHFLGVHAMQALPALALAGAGAAVIWAGAVGWTALTFGAWALALAGVPLSP